MMANSIRFLLALSLAVLGSGVAATAADPKPAPGHDDFIKGLKELGKPELVSGVEAKSASKPRSLSPVVSRFKGWFIDVTEKAVEGELDGAKVAEGISLANKPGEASYWQFVETAKGYLVVATGGKYRGWTIGRDDAAKTRPEGPNLTVTPALRLSEKVSDNSFWDLILTEEGLVLKANAGKYKGWFWDFGGNDPSHEESGRQVAVNVLLAERVVAGSYFEVKAK